MNEGLMNGRKWYKYDDECPGCKTKFRRKDEVVYMACITCGLMLGVPSYRDSERETKFLEHLEGEVMQKMTVAYYCKINKIILEKVERLQMFA